MRAEEQLGFVTVVRPAPELDILGCCFATDAVRLHVVKLQESPLGAAAAARRNKRTLSIVADPDLAFDLGRDVTRVRISSPASPRSVGCGELFLLKFLDEHFQRLRYHLTHVSVRDLMAEKVLGPAQKVMRLLAGRELDLEPRRRQRNHHRLRRRANQGKRFTTRRLLAAGTVSSRPDSAGVGLRGIGLRWRREDGTRRAGRQLADD